MKRQIVSGVLATLLAVAFGSSAFGAERDPTGDPTVTPNQEAGVLNAQGDLQNAGNQETGTVSTADGQETDSPPQLPPGHWVKSTLCDAMSNVGCVVAQPCADGTPVTIWDYVLPDGTTYTSYQQCPEDPEPTAATVTPPVDIPGEVLRAFKTVTLPKSVITVQPPGGETLVNLDTILSTQAERHQITVHLKKVDLDVTLEVWPSAFAWHHGDGTGQETTVPGKTWTPGANLADLVTHTYVSTSKELQVSVDTTWSARFKTPTDADWRDVNGTVTITGAPVPIDVLEAKPQLVS